MCKCIIVFLVFTKSHHTQMAEGMEVFNSITLFLTQFIDTYEVIRQQLRLPDLSSLELQTCYNLLFLPHMGPPSMSVSSRIVTGRYVYKMGFDKGSTLVHIWLIRSSVVLAVHGNGGGKKLKMKLNYGECTFRGSDTGSKYSYTVQCSTTLTLY